MLGLESPLAGHMATHILAMNVVAPLGFLAFRFLGPAGPVQSARHWIGTATAFQLALLWGWHSPAAIQYAFASAAGFAAMQLSLFLAALWFWHSVIAAARTSRWRSILALLTTGKLFCLLGVLLTFAPRPLYPLPAESYAHMGHSVSEAALSDQQLAGLLMVVACPLTYVLASIVVASRWLLECNDRRLPLANGKA
jgi:putative membrane protein